MSKNKKLSNFIAFDLGKHMDNDKDKDDDELGKPFDGLAFGVFMDMWGTIVEISDDDIDEFVDNTLDAMKRTKTSESEELVGLPIDGDNHGHGDAAGWVKDVFADINDLGEKVIRFTPQWNELGKKLIGKNIRRFFSPTIDLDKKLILGGALVNWPASKDFDSGHILLRPVEMSESNGTFILEKNEMSEQLEERMDTLEETLSKIIVGVDSITKVIGNLSVPANEGDNGEDGLEDIEADLNLDDLAYAALGGDDYVNKLQKTFRKRMHEHAEKIRSRSETDMAKYLVEMRHSDLVENFAADVVSGVNGVSLAIEEEKLVEFSKSLSVDNFSWFKEFISDLMTGKIVVDLGEFGADGESDAKTPLPEHWAAKLDEGNISVEDMYNPGMLGEDASNYDFSQWEKK